MSLIGDKIEKINITKIINSKNKQKLVMITAYDAIFSKLFEESADMILVGDSLNMSFLGKKDTLSANMEQMLYHTKAVCTGAKNSFIIFDMPFGSYANKNDALKNAIRVYQETNAAAVKLEGGADKAEIISHLTSNSIAVMGHIGLMPQFVRSEGGYKVKGKNKEQEEQLIKDAIAIEKAGAFAIVLEGIKSNVAEKITQNIKIPTIGIGSGNVTDGQVLVWTDMLGLYEEFKPKFVKHYLNGAKLIRDSVKEYRKEVQDKTFPSKEEEY